MSATGAPSTFGIPPRGLTEPVAVRMTLILISIGFVSVFLVLPLVVVFGAAFSKGAAAYRAALADPDAISAIAGINLRRRQRGGVGVRGGRDLRKSVGCRGNGCHTTLQ